MAKFRLDEESVSRAERMTSRLMRDLQEATEIGPEPGLRREIFSEGRYVDDAAGVPIGDVLENLGQMAAEFAAVRRWDGAIACMKLDDGSLAPISLTEFFGGPSSQAYGSERWIELWARYFGGPFPLYQIWREGLKDSMRDEDSFLITDFREAREGIRRALSSFISYRFAGMKRWVEWIQGKGTNGPDGPRRPFRGRQGNPQMPPLSHGGGLRVRVSCKTRGLRIHVSPAYFISWVYFGVPRRLS